MYIWFPLVPHPCLTHLGPYQLASLVQSAGNLSPGHPVALVAPLSEARASVIVEDHWLGENAFMLQQDTRILLGNTLASS